MIAAARTMATIAKRVKHGLNTDERRCNVSDTFDLGVKPEPNGMPKFGFRTSPDITAIAEAMVSAQAEFGAAIKDSANPAYRSKYADLSSCIEATQKSLSKYGIAVMQRSEEHTSELQSQSNLVCRLLLEKKT